MESQISDRVKLACDIAAGRVEADPNTLGIHALAAKKDLNAKGNGPWWYRMVYRNKSWTYFSSDRLPSGSYRASDRRASIYGDVYPGEIMVQHDRGKAIDQAWLILEMNDKEEWREEIQFSKRRDGNLVFDLPDGSKAVLSNPRS